jgi:hypothetical protein
MEERLNNVIERREYTSLILCYSELKQNEIIKMVCDHFRKTGKLLKPIEIDREIKHVNIPIGLCDKYKQKNFVFCFTDLVIPLMHTKEDVNLFDDDDRIIQQTNYDLSYFDIPKYNIDMTDFDVPYVNENREKIAQIRFKNQIILNYKIC